MSAAHPKEFRDDVAAVARRGEASIGEVATDFGISESCLCNWLKSADVKDRVRPGTTRQDSDELRELQRRNRLLEQENEVLRRAVAHPSQANLNWAIPEMSYPLVRDLADAYATNAAFDVHAQDPGFFYRFIADELADAGHDLSQRRVWRLCSQARIISTHARERGTSRRPGPPVHEDLLERDFTAQAPNQLWLTHITEHHTAEGKLYLCAIKGLFIPAVGVMGSGGRSGHLR